MTPRPQSCPQCGTKLTAGLPTGLCLSCLLSYGLKTAAAAVASPCELEDEIEHFRIGEKIGEGGCGVVYRAEQLSPVRREVAVKLVKLGMDTRNVMARFEGERQALALMDHPGIARVFDAGATQKGRPYFVMELVRGEPITRFCSEHALTLRQRLKLFIDVCQAVQHAHQKGVIHRDLKPSNILVLSEDGHPRPKVIDFGVAKATARQRLADQTIYTVFDQFVGTPAYMSPEQAGLTGEDVDTRTDVYSLGVLLYELIAGAPPFDPERLRQSAIDEVCRIIRDEEPVRPSTRLNQARMAPPKSDGDGEVRLAPKESHLRVDLDWIVMKALEKDRDRRYDTAISLASDILRLLNDEPVGARPPSASYRLRKWVKRHRSLAASGVLIGVVLLASSIISTALAIRAQRAEQREHVLRAEAQRVAEAALAEAEASQHIIALLNSTYDAWRPVAGRRRHTLAWTGVVDELRRQAQTNLRPENRSIIERLTSLIVLADHACWGSDFAAAESMLNEALKLADQLQPRQEVLRAGMLECLGLMLRRAGKTNETWRAFAGALSIRERVQAATPDAIRASYAFTYLCSQAREEGEWERAMELSRLHVDALRRIHGPTNLAVAYAWMDLGRVCEATGKSAEAGEIYSRALDCLRALPPLPNDPELSEICADVIRLFDLVAALSRKMGDNEMAGSLVSESAMLVQHLQQNVGR